MSIFNPEKHTIFIAIALAVVLIGLYYWYSASDTQGRRVFRSSGAETVEITPEMARKMMDDMRALPGSDPTLSVQDAVRLLEATRALPSVE